MLFYFCVRCINTPVSHNVKTPELQGGASVDWVVLVLSVNGFTVVADYCVYEFLQMISMELRVLPLEIWMLCVSIK